jgi:hypothetical protein
MGAGIAYWGTGVSSDVVSKTIAPGATATKEYLTEAAAVPGCTGGKKTALYLWEGLGRECLTSIQIL